MANPFWPEEDKVQKQASRLAKEASDQAIQAARRCLETPQFQEFRKAYEVARELLIEEALRLRLTEPVAYAFKVNNIFERIRGLDAFLNDIKNKAVQRLISQPTTEEESAEKIGKQDA